MSPRFSSVFLIAGFVFSIATALGAQGAAPVRDTNVVLRAGDIVEVQVWRNPEYSGKVVVGVNGALRHPLYQAVPVVGMPLYEAEKQLKQFLSKYVQDPQLIVEPLFRVTVGGEVRQPNLLSLPRSTTVAEAVALAGGPTSEGLLSNVRLIRAGQVVTFDLTSPNATWAHAPIQSGDMIVVAKRSHFFRDFVLPVTGLVGSVASIVNLVRR